MVFVNFQIRQLSVTSHLDALAVEVPHYSPRFSPDMIKGLGASAR